MYFGTRQRPVGQDSDSHSSQRPLARGWQRLVLCLLVNMVVILPGAATVVAQDDGDVKDGLVSLEEMQRPPSFEELIDAERYDWIVLRDNNLVIVCDALWPRPDTFKQLTEERDKLNAIPRRTPAENDRLSELQTLIITLPGDNEEYELKIQQVEDIINFEVLMLERIDLLLDERRLTNAYDLIQRLEAFLPEWEPVVPRFNRLLMLEAEYHEQAGRVAASMSLLGQVYDRQPDYPGLSEQMGRLLSPLIEQAVESKDFRQARWQLRRLSRRFPEHGVVQGWVERLRAQAAAELDRAEKLHDAEQYEEAADVARFSSLIWPPAGRNRNRRDEIMAHHQTVRVAVRSLSDESSFPVPLRPVLRHRELVSVPLFEADSVNEITHYRSAFVEEWDPQDLGRVVTLSLRTSQPYWQPQPLVSAGHVASALDERLDPQSPDYDPRLASFIAGYTVRSPSMIEIRFSRVPLNLAAMFRFPVQVESSDEADDSLVWAGRFRLTDASDRRRIYRRRLAEPDGLAPTQYHIAELVEQQYESRHGQIQAFRRGLVDVLPYVHPWEVDPIRESKLGVIQQFATPVNHVIVFNPHADTVSNPQLRRALSLAVPREHILKKIILRDDAMTRGRISAAGWPQNSYATSPLVDAPRFDLRLAFALRFAAEEQLKIPEKQRLVAEARAAAKEAGEEFREQQWRFDNADVLKDATKDIRLPPLVLLCEPDPVMQQAAERMIEFWGRIGIEVELVLPGAADEPLPEWDMMYRRADMEEPLLDLWPVLLTDHSLDVSLLGGYPDWMRQDLTGLDYAGNFRTARDRLFRIQRNITAQAFLIPLWEVDQFIAFRNGVSGFRERPLSVYDNIERWVVAP